MMLSTKAKTAFLAMPRNASTSIEDALLPYADIAFKGLPRFKHLNLAMYNLRLRPFLEANNYSDIQTVTLFREPVSWLASWYKFRSNPNIRLKRNSTAGVNFNEFVEAFLMDDRPDFANIGQQYHFVADKKSSCGIDFLFKFENFDTFTDFMSERFQADLIFSTQNASTNRNVDLSPQLSKELRDKFTPDYEIYESIAI